MKTVRLPETTIAPANKILSEVLGYGGTQGLRISDMRSRLKMIDKVEAAEGSLDLEDAEHALLVAILNGHAFPHAHVDIVAIADAFAAAESSD